MDKAERKLWRGVVRERQRREGTLCQNRSVRFPDRKKVASKKACRGKVTE